MLQAIRDSFAAEREVIESKAARGILTADESAEAAAKTAAGLESAMYSLSEEYHNEQVGKAQRRLSFKSVRNSRTELPKSVERVSCGLSQ